MRVLVTRPRPAAERTALKLAAMGHQPVVLPLMQAQHFAGAVRAGFERRHDAIAVTSAEAVHALAGLGPALDAHLATPFFAVGSATARAAAELGFADIRVGAGTGEALAETVAGLLGPETGSLLYFAGLPRADGFEHALRERSIDHVTVECYRMSPVGHAPGTLPALVQSGPFDAVLLYSRETARRLVALLRESGLDCADVSARYLCLSASVKEVLPAGVAADVAAAPDEKSLLSLL
ncbi:uroporphyrinogen-III synthase [Sinorhizobium fredii]|jgi:uroporphyrinogen-III synthase|uniref:Uroporphyrinogen-III synthase n=1 Tax=Sinorhizobium fredii (strain USDA 257) TaxID=1185652 RepID=I3XE04_SINF2|nr:uroporphyrinogen-III synthase [Sinorhizobium fredii]AFL54110.1 putative uroporphyrinogen-III synthase protein [Sinorhizobium fredii USDA 257]